MFVAGLRVTDAATMEVAEMVLCGSINKRIAAGITLAGGRAVGLSGKDDGLGRARRKQHIQVDSTLESWPRSTSGSWGSRMPCASRSSRGFSTRVSCPRLRLSH